MGTTPRHETVFHWGDWTAFHYCTESGCGWQGEHVNPYRAHDFEHKKTARGHTQKMNRWWRRLARKATQ